MKLKSTPVKTCFNADEYHALLLEAQVRETNLAKTIRDCLAEYLNLRKEMATAIQRPGKLGDENTGKIIHTLLSRTEARTEIIIQNLEKKIDKIQYQLQQIITMIDHSFLVLLQHLPVISDNLGKAALNQAKYTHKEWQEWVADNTKNENQ